MGTVKKFFLIKNIFTKLIVQLRLVLLILMLFCASTYAYVAIINKTDHNTIHIVPVPGQIVIDGDLKDWDQSGSILMYMNESSMSQYSCQASMMYGGDYLYVACHVKDPTPMVNNYSFDGKADSAWDADAVQLRFFSDPEKRSMVTTMNASAKGMPEEEQLKINHITMWYSTIDKKAGFYVCRTLSYKKAQVNPEGVEGACKMDADGKGYVLEYKIPYGVLFSPRPYKAGDEIQAQFQVHWGMKSGTGLRYGMTDLRNPEGYNDLGYHGPRGWGFGVFEANGNLTLENVVAINRAPGHIDIPFTMHQDGKASLAIYDKSGALVRTCMGARSYKAGEQVYRWDGLSDTEKPLPAGSYTCKVLTHAGVEAKYVCDVGVTGNPPYQNEDNTGGWAGDYRSPFIMCTDGDYIVLGTDNSEAAPGQIVTDLEGQKLYPVGTVGQVRTMGAYRGFGYAVSQNGKLGKFNLENGRETSFTNGATAVDIRPLDEGESQKDLIGNMWNIKSVAFLDETILLSSWNENQVYLIDLDTGKLKKRINVEKPCGMTVTPDRKVYLVSTSNLGTFDLATGEFSPILKELDEPGMLTSDSAGNLYVSIQGKTMQVWKVSTDGQVLQKFGKVGGRPALGTFDPDGMLKPYAIAVDKNNRLWVAENDDLPKRYSVWNPDGKLFKQHLGSHPYSTQSAVDLSQPEFIYIEGVQYQVDYQKGIWEPLATVLRTTKQGDYTFNGCAWTNGGNHSSGNYTNVNGRKFFYNKCLWPVLYEIVEGKYIPRMLLVKAPGRKQGNKPPEPGKIWIDTNNDGSVQDEEIHDTIYRNSFFGRSMDHKMNWYSFEGQAWAAQGSPKLTILPTFKITRLNFKGFNKQGGLEYGDPMNLEVIVEDTDGGAVADIYGDEDGTSYALLSSGTLERGDRPQGSGHRLVKYGPDGKRLWEYQNVGCLPGVVVIPNAGSTPISSHTR